MDDATLGQPPAEKFQIALYCSKLIVLLHAASNTNARYYFLMKKTKMKMDDGGFVTRRRDFALDMEWLRVVL